MKRPAVVDLFSGVGGLSLGAERAGFDVVCSVEIDKQAVRSHRLNFPSCHHIDRDIRNVTGKEILESVGNREIIGVIGGPPCQGFSNMGQQDVNDSRNELFGEFFRLVEELQPAFFLAENVPGILSAKFSRIISTAISRVEDKYYVLTPFRLDSSELGLPTKRRRIFFLGISREILPFELHFDQTTYLVKDALQGLPSRIPKKNFDGLGLVKISTTNNYVEWISSGYRDGIGDEASRILYDRNIVTGFVGTTHSKEVEGRYRKLKYGETDLVSRAVRLDPESYAPTLRAGTNSDKGSYQAVRPIHPVSPRVITPREGARIQGFPDWFQFDETKWHAFRQIGNSVPPPMAWALLEQVKNFID